MNAQVAWVPPGSRGSSGTLGKLILQKKVGWSQMASSSLTLSDNPLQKIPVSACSFHLYQNAKNLLNRLQLTVKPGVKISVDWLPLTPAHDGQRAKISLVNNT